LSTMTCHLQHKHSAAAAVMRAAKRRRSCAPPTAPTPKSQSMQQQ
jgi:hypothetical protein